MQCKFLCNWEDMIEACTASFSVIQHGSLQNKVTFFKSFIRRKRSSVLLKSHLPLESTDYVDAFPTLHPASVQLCLCKSQEPVGSI